MVTGTEMALVKPLVDAFLDLYKKAKTTKLKDNAEKALSEAIRELLLASPNLNSAEAKIAVAKAQGIINSDLILAEKMVASHYVAKKVATKKLATKKVTAKKPTAKKAATKRPAAK